MKKNIYILLNDVSTDTSGYPDTELTEAELQKYRRNIKKKISRKRRKILYTAVAFAACFAVIVTLVYFRPMRQRMRASTGTVTYSLSAMLGVSGDLEDHVLHIGEAKRMEDMTVILNTVAADDGQLVVYTTQIYDDAEKIPRLSDVFWRREYDSEFDDTGSSLRIPVRTGTEERPQYSNWKYTEGCMPVQRVYINGEELKCGVTGEGTVTQMGVSQDVAQYNFPVSELDFPADIKIEIYRNVNSSEPGAVFEVTLDENRIIPNERDVPLNDVIELPDNEEVTVTRFVYNPLGMKIYAKYKDSWKHLDKEEWYLDLVSCEVNGHTAFFKQFPLSDKEVVFIPVGSIMHSEIRTFDEWKIEAFVYKRVEGQEGPSREKIGNFTIPLK